VRLGLVAALVFNELRAEPDRYLWHENNVQSDAQLLLLMVLLPQLMVLLCQTDAQLLLMVLLYPGVPVS
jgi:hypothetical protein